MSCKRVRHNNAGRAIELLSSESSWNSHGHSLTRRKDNRANSGNAHMALVFHVSGLCWFVRYGITTEGFRQEYGVLQKSERRARAGQPATHVLHFACDMLWNVDIVSHLVTGGGGGGEKSIGFI